MFNRFKKLSKFQIILCIILGIALIQRIYILFAFGAKYSLASDDLSYVLSGFTFLKTGKITMHGPISAQILPGMTWIIAVISGIFGQGLLFWVVAKILWIAMGISCVYFTYKIVILSAPQWCGCVAAAFFLIPDFAWVDNLLLSETPYMFAFILLIYATLLLAKTSKWKYFWIAVFFYMMAFLLKPVTGIYPLFAAAYLLSRRYDWKLLLKQSAIIAAVLLCFIVPWSIRNYNIFHAFIPLTYGEGNPRLLGTYQGEGFPADNTLDYETNVDDIMAEKTKGYLIDDKYTPAYMEYYFNLIADGIKADYRQQVWRNTNPLSMLKSYLLLKPQSMYANTYASKNIMKFSPSNILLSRQYTWILAQFFFALSFIARRHRREMLLFMGLFVGFILIYSTAFAFSRYSHTLYFLEFLMIGYGMSLIPLIHKGQKALDECGTLNTN